MLWRLCNFRYFYFLSLPRKGWENKNLLLVLFVACFFFFFFPLGNTPSIQRSVEKITHMCVPSTHLWQMQTLFYIWFRFLKVNEMLHVQLKPSVLYSLADTIPKRFLPFSRSNFLLLILILITFLCTLLRLCHPDLCVPINNKGSISMFGNFA